MNMYQLRILKYMDSNKSKKSAGSLMLVIIYTNSQVPVHSHAQSFRYLYFIELLSWNNSAGTNEYIYLQMWS